MPAIRSAAFRISCTSCRVRAPSPGSRSTKAGLGQGRQREHDDARGRPVPGAGRQGAGAGEVGHLVERAGARSVAQRPGRRGVEINRGGRGWMAGRQAGGSREHHPVALGLVEIDEGEREVAGAGGETAGAEGAGVAHRARFRRRGRDLAEQRQPALADDALGVVGVGAEDAAGAPLLVGDRAVGEGVVGLLGVAVAMHDEEEGPRRRSPRSSASRRRRGAAPRPRSPARRRTRAVPAPAGVSRRRWPDRRRCRG
jgi:hypothetical protein